MSWSHSDEMEARADRARQRRATRCQCGDDLPGSCPGPAFCPNVCADEDEPEAEAEETEE